MTKKGMTGKEKTMTTLERTPGTELTHQNPWTDLFGWNSRVGQLLENAWHTRLDQLGLGAELEETDDAYLIEFDVPGVAKKDIAIDVTGRRVCVHGAREEKERTGVLRHSTRTGGNFSYEVRLPSPVDDQGVTATLDGGVLTVRVPKSGDAKTTRVEIE
jgi:HSP20 family protein